jgi:hypothetical protein
MKKNLMAGIAGWLVRVEVLGWVTLGAAVPWIAMALVVSLAWPPAGWSSAKLTAGLLGCGVARRLARGALEAQPFSGASDGEGRAPPRRAGG